MLIGTGDSVAYLHCRGVIDQTQETNVTSEQAFREGWIAVSPDYFADVMAYRANLERWMVKHCN